MMVLFADGGTGLFFNEWYWDAIFRALSALPVLALVAVLTGVALRIWLTLPVCAGIAASILVAGTALLLVVNLYVEYGQHARDSRAIARTVQFTTYEPRPLPPRFLLRRSAAAAGRDAPAIYAFYSMTGNGWASVTQERPPGDRRTRYSRDCLLEGAGDPCREVRSSKGIRVMVAKDGPVSVEASALLGGTLVNVIGDRLTEPDVLAYIDALRPTDPDDLEFKRG